MKKVIILILLIFVVFVSYYGYQRYLFNKIILSTHPLVKNTSLRVNNSLSFEINKTNISYNELFLKIESDITEIDKNVLVLQLVATSKTKEEIDNVLEYINVSRDVLRSQLRVYRKRLAVRISLDMSDRAISYYKETSSFTGDIALKHAESALRDADKEVKYLQDSEKELSERLLDLLESRNKVAMFLPVDILINQSLLDNVMKKYL
jgi:hypothetical protein